MTKKRKDIDKFTLLTELMDHFNFEADVSSYADFLLQFIEEHFGFKKLILKLISNTFDELYLVSSRGLSKRLVSFSTTKLGIGVSGKVALSGKPMIVEDIAENEVTVLLAKVFKKEEVHSLLSIPLATKNEIIGVINIYEKDSKSISIRVAHHIMAITNFAAIFIAFIHEKSNINDKLCRLKQYSTKLARVQSFHEFIMKSIPIGVVVTDVKGNVVLMNRALEEMSLLRLQECLGKKWFEVFGFDGEVRRKLESSFRTSSPRLFSMIDIPLKNGSALSVEMKTDIIRDQSGDPAGVIAICSNIEEKKKIEQEIEKVERLVAVGKLASGIAHEIRNPLAGISGVIQVMKDEFSSYPKIESITDRLLTEIERLDNVVEKLNGIALPKKMNIYPHSVTDVIEDILFFIQKPLKTRGITLTKNLQNGLNPIMIDRDAIYQVILNVMINAMNAMTKGGGLGVETVFLDSLDILESDIVWHNSSFNHHPVSEYGRDAGPFMSIIISDNGIGISQTILPKIFEAFFTTSTEGTGLGLYISARIIDQHGGIIGVKSERGKGSVFYILLPANKELVNS